MQAMFKNKKLKRRESKLLSYLMIKKTKICQIKGGKARLVKSFQPPFIQVNKTTKIKWRKER